MEQKNDTPMVPLFEAENTVIHLGFANRRMLIALITVCVTFIVTIIVFTVAHTVREKNWIDAITHMKNTTPTAAEVQDGVRQPADP